MPNAGPPNANRFTAPTAQQLERHLAANPPMVTTGWQARLPQIALIAAMVMMMVALLQPALALVPMLMMVGLVIYVSGKTRAAQELSRRVSRTWELAMIRRHRDAMTEAWRLIPDCKANPELHGRVVTVIAHVLGELRREDAAEVAYGYLLDRLPNDHPLSLRLRLQRAIAALSTDRLADADDALRKLRGQAEQAKDPALLSVYTKARLLQDVRTGHYADAVAQADNTAEALKPLGVEAGYGYGLLALCNQQLALRDNAEENDNASDHAMQARLWWDRATILIPPAALIFRFPELKKVSDTFSITGSGVVSDDVPDAGTTVKSTPDPFNQAGGDA